MKNIGLLILTSIAIALMIPGGGAVSLTVSSGQEWTEKSIIAPFDIPISKSRTEIEAERNELRHNLRPVFRIDTAVGAAKAQQLRQTLLGLNNPIVACDSAYAACRRVYGRGIMSADDIGSYANSTIMVADDGNHLAPAHISSIYTPSKAIEAVATASGIASTQLKGYFLPNLLYDEQLTTALRDEALKKISTTRGVIRAGELVVARGQVVDNVTRQKLASLSSQYESRISEGVSGYVVFLSRFIIVFALLMLNFLFFTKFSVHYFGDSFKKILFVMMLYVIFCGFISIVSNSGTLNPYVIPLPVVTIYILTFFNMRVAILVNITIAALGALFVKLPFDFFAINFIGGMAGIFMMRHFYHRGKLMRAIGVIFLTQSLIYICFSVLREGGFGGVSYGVVLWFLVSSFLTMGFYQAIYLLERLFGFVSDITLLEMCDTNQPLLMNLAQNAPGTFQHSVQVANLAESAAKAIGGNPMLARAGALYHDIGKMENPFYFVENLSGTFNPHDDCTPAQSAHIVKNHVADGIAIGKKYKLPSAVIDFIATHHGTSLIYYFWVKAQDGGQAIEADYRYAGPKPLGREVSICMMADAVEAASRSLPSYDKEPLEALVDSVIDSQIADKQFSESELSFQEIAKIKELFKSKLNNIYHGRIAYPVRK